MGGFKSLLLLAVVYISGLITGSPITANILSKAPAAMVGVTTRTKDPIDLGWLSLARESVVLVATPTGHGSGVCFERVEEHVFILTAKHVISHRDVNETNITIMGQVNRTDYQLPGTLALVSDKYDLAIVGVYDPNFLIRVSHLAKESPNSGELAIAMGFPGDSYPVVSTVGFFNGWAEWGAIYLEHSASIWFGNSGGPVFDANGFIVGLNVRIDELNGRPNGNDCGAVPVEDILLFLRR